jgi:hypothetical protein
MCVVVELVLALELIHHHQGRIQLALCGAHRPSVRQGNDSHKAKVR